MTEKTFRKEMLRVFCGNLILALVFLSGQSVSGGGLEVVAELSQGPGNIAVTPDGRLIVSQHGLFFPHYRVVEVLPSGKTKPFPNEQWATLPDKESPGLTSVSGVQCDRQGIVWMLDSSRDFARVVAWDTKRDALHKTIDVGEPGRVSNSFFNDLALDPVHKKIYISDPASPYNSAIVVVDMETGKSRRVLEGHATVVPEPLAMVIGSKTMAVDQDGKGKATMGVDAITIDPKSEWVYYGAAQTNSLWRVRTSDLTNESLSVDGLASRVERYGDRPICDGITVDGAGNVYITDITSYAVGVVEPSGKYRILHKDEKRLSWPDGMSFGPDGYIYVVANQLHLCPVFNMGQDLSVKPYYLVRFKALAEGAVGR
jgi:sugar lactone lactonase YvrE